MHILCFLISIVQLFHEMTASWHCLFSTLKARLQEVDKQLSALTESRQSDAAKAAR